MNGIIGKMVKLKQTNIIGKSFNLLWIKRFNELEKFKLSYGHCNVPYAFSNKHLAYWVGVQRGNYKKNTLNQERANKLERLGFKWNRREDLWANMLEELKIFKEKYGHCNVPRTYQRNHKLAVWVLSQRRRIPITPESSCFI